MTLLARATQKGAHFVWHVVIVVSSHVMGFVELKKILNVAKRWWGKPKKLESFIFFLHQGRQRVSKWEIKTKVATLFVSTDVFASRPNLLRLPTFSYDYLFWSRSVSQAKISSMSTDRQQNDLLLNWPSGKGWVIVFVCACSMCASSLPPFASWSAGWRRLAISNIAFCWADVLQMPRVHNGKGLFPSQIVRWRKTE